MQLIAKKFQILGVNSYIVRGGGLTHAKWVHRLEVGTQKTLHNTQYIPQRPETDTKPAHMDFEMRSSSAPASAVPLPLRCHKVA